MVDEFATEEEQVERLKQWWSENGRFVIIGAVLGIALIGSFRYWQDYRVKRAEDAGDALEALYIDMDAGNFEEVQAAAKNIEQKYAATPYDDYALLALAKMQIENDDVAGAKKSLQTVLDRTKDRQMKHVARTRLARLMIHSGQAQQALTLLENNNKSIDPDGFATRYAEIKGDAYVALNQPQRAKEAYQQALDSFKLGTADPKFIEMKLAATDVNESLPASDVEVPANVTTTDASSSDLVDEAS
ncbi:MAG: tetratricopeptide repeat protein [Gammaproteobacteria bacterium]|nr:tetratricopeptide repeat protein [Gammaproteobacteria bacterium]